MERICMSIHSSSSRSRGSNNKGGSLTSIGIFLGMFFLLLSFSPSRFPLCAAAFTPPSIRRHSIHFCRCRCRCRRNAPFVLETTTTRKSIKIQKSSSSSSMSILLSWPLYSSVLADSDTLPHFSTACGLLSPETVMRLDNINNNLNHPSPIPGNKQQQQQQQQDRPSQSQSSDSAACDTIIDDDDDENEKEKAAVILQHFLDTYRQEGPLSCLPMLSDPLVLPILTNAMREIVT